jgi:hypothetical protein
MSKLPRENTKGMIIQGPGIPPERRLSKISLLLKMGDTVSLFHQACPLPRQLPNCWIAAITSFAVMMFMAALFA